MAPARITGALLARIGEPAAVELTQLLREQQREATEAMMTHCAERFERRLTEEISLLRVAIGDGFAGIRREMSTDRVEMLNEVSTGRVEMLKWAFAFWIGQVAAISAIVALLTRR
jgi:hypothetical protein